MPSQQLTIGQQGNCTKSKKERRGVTVFVNMFFLKLNSYFSTDRDSTQNNDFIQMIFIILFVKTAQN